MRVLEWIEVDELSGLVPVRSCTCGDVSLVTQAKKSVLMIFCDVARSYKQKST